MAKENLVCKNCNKIFIGRTSIQIYCSKKCRWEDTRKKKRPVCELDRIAKLSREADMSYGNYVAKVLKD